MFSFYVDPARIDPAEMFPAEVVRYVDFVKQSRPAAPGGETLLPGEKEARTREERLAQGVPLPEETWNLILDTARSVGADAGVESSPAPSPGIAEPGALCQELRLCCLRQAAGDSHHPVRSRPPLLGQEGRFVFLPASQGGVATRNPPMWC